MAKIENTATIMDSLTSKQATVLPLLLSGKTDGEAAKSAGIARTTISGWRKNSPEFRQAERSLRGQALEFAQSTFRSLAEKAVAALAASLGSKNERIRLDAAKHVCDRLGLHLFPDSDPTPSNNGEVDMDAVFRALGVTNGAIQ